MKILIYDKWLHVMGGGEVVACLMAKSLTEYGDVILASDKKVSANEVKAKLGISLGKAKLIQVNSNGTSIQALTENVDIFINTSFMDYTYAGAARNIYYVHFPTENIMSVLGELKREIIFPLLDKYFRLHVGATNSTKLIKNRRVCYLMDSRGTAFEFSNLNPKSYYTATMFMYYEAISSSLLFNTDICFENAVNVEITYRLDHRTNVLKVCATFAALKADVLVKLVVKEDGSDVLTSTSRVYVLEPYLLSKGISQYLPVRLLQRIHQRMRAGVFNDMKTRLASYDEFWSNSQYTAKWVKKYWNKKSRIIYPPVSLFSRKKCSRNKWLVSTGRFFRQGHGKRQELLVDAFKRLYDRGNTDWELHLIGGLNHMESESVEYIESLKSEAKGYPIFFHVNVSRDEMEAVLNKAMIYWHAAGLGARRPVAKEHFGIAIVEAISAGCIPIVINEGGVPEIIRGLYSNHNQHLYNSMEELIHLTSWWISNFTQYKSPKSEILLSKFSEQAFIKRIHEALL